MAMTINYEIVRRTAQNAIQKIIDDVVREKTKELIPLIEKSVKDSIEVEIGRLSVKLYEIMNERTHGEQTLSIRFE